MNIVVILYSNNILHVRTFHSETDQSLEKSNPRTRPSPNTRQQERVLDESARKYRRWHFSQVETEFFEAYRTPKTEIGPGRTSRPKSSCVSHTHTPHLLLSCTVHRGVVIRLYIYTCSLSPPQAASSLVACIYLPFQAFYFRPYLFRGTFTLKVFRYLYTSLYLENRPSFLSLSLSLSFNEHGQGIEW